MSSSPLQSPTRFWRILAATWVAYATYSMVRRPLSIVRAKMIDHGDMTLQESGAIDTSFLIMYTVGQLFYTNIRSHLPFPSRTILALGLVGSSLCFACFAFLSFNSVIIRCLLWGILGTVQAVGWASCLVVITPWLEPKERGTVMGIWGTNMALGGVVGNTVSASVLSFSKGSWVSVFGVAALFSGIISVIIYFWLGSHPNVLGILTAAQVQQQQQMTTSLSPKLRENVVGSNIEGEWIVANKFEDHRDDEDNDDNKTETTSSSSQQQHPIKIQGVLPIALAYAFHKLVRYVLMLWMPFYLTQSLHMDSSTAGFVATAFDIGGIFGTVGGGILADKIGSRVNGSRVAFTVTIFGIGMCLTLMAFALDMNGNGNFGMTLFLCFFSGAFAFGIDSLMTGSLLQDHCERVGAADKIGSVGAFVGAVGTFGSILQGPFTVAFSSFSWHVLFGVCVVCTGIAVVLLLPVVRAESTANNSSNTNHSRSVSTEHEAEKV